jgi:hypothetical protein
MDKQGCPLGHLLFIILIKRWFNKKKKKNIVFNIIHTRVQNIQYIPRGLTALGDWFF